ncbi:MAG TPA: 16S rRNA (guanine(966)-N(2))-methyltransferase RsmD [Clostridia bacterium]|nr:16S rRNA (guanine(966)-N(2))-methyltransferase RsmD [Clostridia bacterium]
MPRIIAGEAGGIRIQTLEGRNTRPTGDRAKEALFSMLGDIYYGKAVLDLFAGSGSLGLEAVSRGASSVVFVDQNPRCAEIIRKNAAMCRFNEKVRILRADSAKALRVLSEEKRKFGCIFLDPPYDKNLVSSSIENILTGDIIENEGILVIEHSSLELPKTEGTGLEMYRNRNYGAINFSIFIYRNTRQGDT